MNRFACLRSAQIKFHMRKNTKLSSSLYCYLIMGIFQNLFRCCFLDFSGTINSASSMLVGFMLDIIANYFRLQ